MRRPSDLFVIFESSLRMRRRARGVHLRGRRRGLEDLISSRRAAERSEEYAYQYGDIGSRITALDLGTNHTYTANSLNQYTQISNLCDSASLREEFIPVFDLDGNQTLIKTATGVWQVTYNGENRPVNWTCGSTNITMKFDRMGRRVEYVETVNSVTNTHHRFVYDGYLCIQRLNAASNNAVDLAFGWDPTEPIATRPLWMQRPAGSYNFFYFHDGNKNVSDLVSYQSARGVPAHSEYAPLEAAYKSVQKELIDKVVNNANASGGTSVGPLKGKRLIGSTQEFIKKCCCPPESEGSAAEVN